jgi:hypothetical protein
LYNHSKAKVLYHIIFLVAALFWNFERALCLTHGNRLAFPKKESIISSLAKQYQHYYLFTIV